MKTHSIHRLFFPRRTLPHVIGLCFFFSLIGCSSAPVEPQQSSQQTKGAHHELLQQRFAQGKTLFLSKQYAEAATVLLPLAQQGHVDAQYTIGYMYHYGHGLPRNAKESTRWIATAAGKGHALAKEALTRINASHDQHGVLSTPSSRP